MLRDQKEFECWIEGSWESQRSPWEVQATGDERYLNYGEAFMEDLQNNSWVSGGWASLRSVATLEKEDHMHSFFLAETCKYLFLLFNDTFLQVISCTV